MPPKKKVTLPDHVRAAVRAEVGLSYQNAREADETSKIRIYLAIEQGLDQDELAEELGDVSQQTISRWARQGKDILARREREKRQRESAGGWPAGQDPLRPGEPEPVR